MLTRYVILGDPHISPDEIPLWNKAIEDIHCLSPDAVLILGDLTGGQWMGTHDGLSQALDILNHLPSPWYSIIGNHDLQSPEFDSDQAAVSDWLSQTGNQTPWFSHDLGPLSVIGLSNTQWRANPGNKNEIVINDQQMVWWREQLNRLANQPVLILGHAPSTGSGLLTLSEHHCQVGNAYVNENHFPGQVQKVVHENPNILFWFSGHNHMGQHYRDSITLRQGVHYVHTGVVSRHCSRDGQRHSRVLDIEDQAITIRTFDHVRRCMDDACEHHEPYGLKDFFNYRKAIYAKRMVPRDSTTMRQGPGPLGEIGGNFQSGVTRFAFLTDSHLVQPVDEIRRRALDWCVQQIKQRGVDRIVFGGDMIHQNNPAVISAILSEFFPDSPSIDYLPGNNEGAEFIVPQEHQQVRLIKGCQPGGDGWPARTFFLQTTHAQDAKQSAGQLIQKWPAQGNVLVLAHFPPELTGDTIYNLAKEHPDQHIWWICGHKHQNIQTDQENLHVIICAGLDPTKVRGSMPSLRVVDWDGDKPIIQTLDLPENFYPAPNKQNFPIGLACRNDATELVATALKYDIACLQFHYQFSQGEPGEPELEAIGDFRSRFPDGFASLHLPNFVDGPDGPVNENLPSCLQWAKAAGLNDLTAHLPAVPADRLFDENRNWRQTPWACAAQRAYLQLAEQALAMGAQLSLENVYNSKRVGPDQEKLSCRPWHLISFVQWLRKALADKGYPPDQVQRVGIIFDAGHAFRDAVVAKEHGLADWLEQVSPYLQLAHIHQVGPNAQGKSVNHQPITSRFGPMINYAGFLATLNATVKQRVPLLIEVRDRQQALDSYQTLMNLALR